MRITVPRWAEEHFWDEPPEGSREFWAFRFPPRCRIGEKIEFFMRGKKVAEALVDEVEPPGQSKCDATGRFRDRWKVFWRPESFVELPAWSDEQPALLERIGE